MVLPPVVSPTRKLPVTFVNDSSMECPHSFSFVPNFKDKGNALSASANTIGSTRVVRKSFDVFTNVMASTIAPGVAID